MLTADETELVIDDMFEKRHDDLVRSKAGKFYEPELVELREELHGIPPELRGTPLAGELLEADEEHDGYGRVLFYATEAVLQDPACKPENKEAAELIRAQFIPTLSELQDRYLDEAKRAKDRKETLEDKAVKAALKRVPNLEHGTLFEVATKFVAAGLRLHDLLSDRGDVVKPDRRAAITVRPKLIGVLNELRAKLKKEVAKDPKLPRDLEQRVFGYFDTVVGMRKPAAKAPRTAKAPPAPAAPADGPK